MFPGPFCPLAKTNVIVTVSVPELAPLLLSPPYEHSIATLPAELPVAVTLHDPEESVHVDEENDTPPVPLCDHVTVPVGLLPVTVAVHVEVPLTVNEVGEHEIDVEVEALEGAEEVCGGCIISIEFEPELSIFSVSPPYVPAIVSFPATKPFEKT